MLAASLISGITVVECAGPAILEMLHAHTLGENRAHFGKLAAHILDPDLNAELRKWICVRYGVLK